MNEVTFQRDQFCILYEYIKKSYVFIIITYTQKILRFSVSLGHPSKKNQKLQLLSEIEQDSF